MIRLGPGLGFKGYDKVTGSVADFPGKRQVTEIRDGSLCRNRGIMIIIMA